MNRSFDQGADTMPDDNRAKEQSDSSRRTFIKNSAAAVVVGGTLALQRAAHAQSEDVLKVGLIGCGGRGSGAAANAVNADPNTRLTAMCDVFPDALEDSRQRLTATLGEKCTVDDDHCFSGFDGYQRLLETDVDVVLLCTPPHFRPAQLQAAIDAGKHVFCEKPVAVDAPGVRSVLKTSLQASEKKLNIVSGLCWRYDHGVRETMKRIQDGAIGDIVAIQENYLAGTLWHRGRDPKWSEMEYQMRNWLYFTWLSGDHVVEQHIHSLDKAMWLMGDDPPISCFGLGGRQVRTEEKWGHIYDHFSVCYEWTSGVKTFANTRQMRGCAQDVEDYVLGTKGQAKLLKHSINGEVQWDYPRQQRRRKPSMYDVEHQELLAAIRAGTPINNGIYMSRSTMMAIMGRMACYTGQVITWDDAMNSEERLGPDSYDWGDVPVPEVALPGIS
jgi:predicted dehydrogenase